MDNRLEFITEQVLKQKTKQILSEIRRLMKEGGVEACLKDRPNKKDKKDKEDMPPGRSQFQSLMDAAREAACVEELVLFLSYQESKKGGWGKKCADGATIAKKVVDSLMSTVDLLYSCIAEACEGQDISDDDERMLRLKIAEKYLGYLYWTASAV